MEPHSDFDLCSTNQMWLFVFSVPPIRCGCFCSLFHQSDVAVADGQGVAERCVTVDRTAGQGGTVQTDLLTCCVSHRQDRRSS